jgi:hypothetical protein
VVSDHVGRLGDLAVATAFRGALDVDGDVICRVAVRYHVEGRPEHLTADEVPRTTAAIIAMRGLVVEVHCLPVTAPLPRAELPGIAEAKLLGGGSAERSLPPSEGRA